MENNPLYKTYQIMKLAFEALKVYDTCELYPPADAEAIAKWEAEHHAELPEDYKNFLLLSDGFYMGAEEFLPLKSIHAYPYSKVEGQDILYVLGYYIGDGSMLVSDKDGEFYELDHDSGLNESDVAVFLDDWVMQWIEEGLMEMHIIDHWYGRGEGFGYSLSAEKKSELLAFLKARIADTEV